MKKTYIVFMFILLTAGFFMFTVWQTQQKSIDSAPVNPAWEWDISNLEIQTDAGSLTAITLEEAIRLKETFPEGGFAEEDLRGLEAKIFDETGFSATYYQFVGGFTCPQIKALSGRVVTLLVAVDSETPYIYWIETPITEVSISQAHVVWAEMAGAATIEAGQTSARVAVKGYVTVYDKDPPTADKLSNTLAATYTFFLKDKGTVSTPPS